MSSERWLPVVGYEGRYEVSDWGRVRSLIAGVILRPAPYSGWGHVGVALHKDGKQTTLAVHQLVLEAFVGPRPPGMVCRHFPDSDPSFNYLGNIQWGTPEQNMADKNVHGTHNKGERHGMSSLVEVDVLEIRRLYATRRYSQRQLAERFGTSQTNVSYIVRNKAWSHV